MLFVHRDAGSGVEGLVFEDLPKAYLLWTAAYPSR